MNKHLLDIYCIATSLNDLVSDMTLEQAVLILGVPADASKEEIIKSYKRLVHLYHPDKPEGDALKFKLITKAKEVMLENLAGKRAVKPVKKEGPGSPDSKWGPKGHPWGSWYDREIGRAI